MNILAIESSDKIASIAIVRDDILLYEETLGNQRTHSEKLLPMIENALQTVQISYDEIDAFAVNQGPGSFTGLRIGICTANALAMAYKKPIIAVSAFESLAGNVDAHNTLICPSIDARNTQVYAIAYWGKKEQCTAFAGDIGIWLKQVEQIYHSLADSESICFIGSGALAQRECIEQYFGSKAIIASKQNMYYRASTLAMLASEKMNKKEYVSEVMPFYVRRSQAERERFGE